MRCQNTQVTQQPVGIATGNETLTMGERMSRVLLIDDDTKLGDLLRGYLKRFDLELLAATHPDEGMALLDDENPDLVLLDVMLPGRDGFEVCREIRKQSNVPVIMLTARGEVTDRIVGLELGADDYLPKPFEPRELVARIQNILRRASREADDKEAPAQLSFDGLEIDLERRSAELDGELLDLTTMEYQLLALLAANPGRSFTRDEILNDLRGIDAQLFSRSVDILVSRLRAKLNDTSKQPRFIRTVWGTGYAFVAGEARD